MSPVPAPGRIVLIDDEQSVLNILSAILRSEGYAVETAPDGATGIRKAREFQPNLVIVDLQMPRLDGIETLKLIKEQLPHTAAIILTAHGSIHSAVEAMRAGAYDYLTKPFDNAELLIVVERAIQHSCMVEELDDLRAQVKKEQGVDAILGESPVIRELKSALLRVAPTTATVLIMGESGSGKELAARAIHYEGNRRSGPLLVVNCAAVPPHLAESEFFGHEKGAFTDANERRIGKFEEANGGSIFLDEVAELPADIQAKLLRILQEKELTRIGSNAPVQVDVRVIAATNKDLAKLVSEGKFREDLYYRLSVVTLRVPALREHPEDIPFYARHTASKAARAFGREVKEISAEALSLLQSQSWKGNIRELENVIQRAVIFATGERIEPYDLVLDARSADIGNAYDLALGLEAAAKRAVEDVERKMILEALKHCDWHRAGAAEKLQISRRTLYLKIKGYHITPPPSRAGWTDEDPPPAQ